MTDHRPATADRIPCCVHACRRGIGAEAWRKRFGDIDVPTAQYVCQRHWSRVPTTMRLIYARARRRERRFGARLPSTDRIWRRIMSEVLSLE